MSTFVYSELLEHTTLNYILIPCTGLLKVLYTDYESALLYVCHKVHNDHCVPSNELVLVLGRTSFLTDSQIIDMVEVVPDTCFTKDDFKYLPEEGNQCGPFNKENFIKCKL